MYKKQIFLISIVLVLGLAVGAHGVLCDVPAGQTITVTGTETCSGELNVNGTLIIESTGDVTCGAGSTLDGSGSTIILNGGSFHCTARFNVGQDNDGYIYVNGGTFTVDGTWKFPDDDGGIHRMWINAGIVHSQDIELRGERDAIIYIGDGILRLDEADLGGDEHYDPLNWIKQKWLQPAQGFEDLNIAEGPDYTEITAVRSGPIAENPSPERGMANLCPDVKLSWTPGEKTQPVGGHDVYFGTDLSAVADATTTDDPCGVYMGRQDVNNFDPGTLELSTAYYWRIDQVNDVSSFSPWKGAVWSFTTNDGRAYSPYPADEALRIPLDAQLSWVSGCVVDSHDVYFDTDFNDVNEADRLSAVYKGNQPVEANSYDPGGLENGTFYYWRIDEVSGAEIRRGNVWSFKSICIIPDPNLLVWCKLDETAGDDVTDSSGHDFHGDGVDIDDDDWDPADGRFPGCIEMDNDQRIDIDLDVLGYMDDSEVTIAVWLKGPYREGSTNWLFGWGTDSNMAVMAAIPDETEKDVTWQAGDDANDLLIWEDAGVSDWANDWHHFAFVKNENAGTMSIYFDAVEVAYSPDVNVGTLANINAGAARVSVGANWEDSDDFVGKVDDFRIYDYALSATEIKELARGELAWQPSPPPGSTEVSRDVILGWRPGDSATSHDVYFGTDFNDVNDAGTSSDEYKGNQLRDANSYDPGGLPLNATYYWRIDEISDSNTYKGTIWNFTVAEYIVIDDMESYCPGEVGGCAIMNNWLDGLENDSGATIKLGVEGTFPVSGGEQSMEFNYDNDGDVAGWPADEYSEADRELNPAEEYTDWTILDLKTLRLYFYGAPDNDANEQMYVALKDNVGAFVQVNYGSNGEDMNDVKEAEWQQWNIKLSDFSGVDLANVRKIYLGFGDRDNPVTGGDGVVYFDDIRLYIQTCVAYLLQPEADLNDDCIVNELDIEVMGEQWLDRDIVFDEWTEPSTDGLVGWWKLDDGSGDTAVDSSGQGNDGTLEALEGTVSWAAGHDGGAVEFNGGRILVPDAEELRPIDVVSACAWVYISDGQNSARVVVKGNDNRESYALEIDESDQLVFHVRDVNNNNYAAEQEVLNLDEWFHIAGTFDGDILRCYLNGVMVEDNNEPNNITLSQDPNGLAIGNRSDDDNRGFEGIIDDVRVYNRVLSDAEIAYLASDGTGLVEIQSVADLHSKESVGDRVVNFKDYAALINAWLDEKLWPPLE